MNDINEGDILVAHPELNDPDFGGSVILILSNDEGGAVGINIAGAQAESGVSAGGPMPSPPLLLYQNEPVVFEPQSRGRGFWGREVVANLGRRFARIWPGKKAPPPRERLVGNSGYALRTVASDDTGKLQPADTLELPTSLIFIGYAGWGAQQLAQEIGYGIWGKPTLGLDALLKLPQPQRWQTAVQGAKFATMG